MNIVRGVQDKLDEKVNKVDGMGLYPDADKTKVAKIGDTSDLENGVTVMSKINGLISSIGSLKEKLLSNIIGVC